MHRAGKYKLQELVKSFNPFSEIVNRSKQIFGKFGTAVLTRPILTQNIIFYIFPDRPAGSVVSSKNGKVA